MVERGVVRYMGVRPFEVILQGLTAVVAIRVPCIADCTDVADTVLL